MIGKTRLFRLWLDKIIELDGFIAWIARSGEEFVMEVTVAAVQPLTYREREQRNVQVALKYIDEAADKGAKIISFPEGYPGPYRGPIVYSALEDLSAKAKERRVYVIAGCVEKAEPYERQGIKNVFFLSQKIIGPKGKLLGTYSRVQTSMPEVDRFLMADKIIAPGEELRIYKTEYGNLGFLICSEIWCPELARVLALDGADIIFAPIGGAIYEIYDRWKILLQARATENHVYIVAPQNLFGMEDGLGSIVGPEEILAESKKPGVITAKLDLDRLKWLREHTQRMEIPKPYKSIPGMLRYRRPELYKKLTDKQPNAIDFYYFMKKKRP